MNSKYELYYQQLGLNIAYYRKLRHMTQLDLAEFTDMSRTHISNIEAPNMVKTLSLETLFNIAKALNVSASRLLEFRDAGCAILLISADLTEIFSLSDRLAVMYKGKFAGFFTDVEHVTEDELGQHMLGIKHDDVLEGVMYE